MAEQLTIEPDYNPVNPDLLEVYGVAPVEPGEDPPTTLLETDEFVVKSPIAGFERERAYRATVEYRSDEFALSAFGVHKYFDALAEARMTQEALTKMAYRHIKNTLELDHGDVFIQISRVGEDKQMLMGEL